METKIEKINGFDFSYWILDKSNKEYDFASNDAFDIIERTNSNIDQIIYLFSIDSDDFPNKSIDDLFYAFRKFKNMNDDKIVIYRRKCISADIEPSCLIKDKIIKTIIKEYHLLERTSGEMSILRNMNNYCNFEFSEIYLFKTTASKRLCIFLDLVESVEDFKFKTGVSLNLDHLSECIFSDSLNDLVFDKKYLKN